jgi:hypothetical protein
MIKFLFNTFGNVPGIGGPIKAAYVGSLVNELVQKGKDSPAKAELKGLAGNELESALNDQANSMYDEHIGPVVAQNNIPNVVHQPIKEKAITRLVEVMRAKVQQQANKNAGTK